MKPLIRKFILTNSIILCVLLLLTGGITVRQRSEYNMYRNDYSTLRVKRQGEGVLVNVDSRQVARLDLSVLSQYKNAGQYLKFTPVGSAIYLVHTLNELF